MADLNKLKGGRKAQPEPKAEALSIRPTTRASGDERVVQVVFRISESKRTAFKRRALDEGTTVQAVLEAFVDGYTAED
ncbi:hypothetical protein [Microbacterium sp.]|uniref:hypothetical protein n=1 Tax=Microbacterium sp. TaxID=51671 RepID=UPI003F979BC5